MEDNFDYRIILEELDMREEIFEEELLQSWSLVLINHKLAIYMDYKGETRTISANYINNLFSSLQ